ncbi:MAG: aldo/keto reductase [Actinomycetales bacterium]|nr:aldo/keto reductase [Actinomycetales bacterium]
MPTLASRPLGASGIPVLPLSLGTADFGGPLQGEDPTELVAAAIARGLTLFDTAEGYTDGRSEEELGRAVARLGIRDQILILSKAAYPQGVPGECRASRSALIRACDASLRRLATDRIDIYVLHRPWFDIRHEETLAALTELVRAGKIRYFGASHYPAWKLVEGMLLAQRAGVPGYLVEQPPYNLLDRRVENDVSRVCLDYGIALITASPLGGGILAGIYNDGNIPPGSRADVWRDRPYRQRVNEAAIGIARRLAALAESAGITPSQLALAWLVRQPAVTSVLIAPKSQAELADNCAVLDLAIEADLLASVDALVPAGTFVSDFFSASGWTLGQTRWGRPGVTSGSGGDR